jgi:mono/diheme cytochrome c family protein
MTSRFPALIFGVASLGFIAACSSQTTDATATSRTSPAAAASAAVSPAVLEQGRALYQKNCTACHGESGKGDGPGAGVLKPPPRDHTDKAYMSTLSDKQIADVIKMGGAIKGKPLMPSHPQFKDPELQALVAYIRSLAK